MKHRPVLPHPYYAGALALLWCFLQGRLSVAQLLIGYGISAGILWFFQDFWPYQVRIRRPWLACRLCVRFLWAIVVANVQVAWVIIRPWAPIRPALIRVPLALDHEIPITVLASMITLTPGTLSVDVDQDRSAIIVHCLHTTDPDRTAKAIKADFEQPLQEIVQCSTRV